MKKHLIALLALAPVLCFGAELLIPSTGTVVVSSFIYSGTSTSPSVGQNKKCLASELSIALLDLSYGAKFGPTLSLVQPQTYLATNSYTNRTRTIDYPITYDSCFYALVNNAHGFISLLQISGILYSQGLQSSGFSNPHYDSSNNLYLNIRLDRVLADVLQSTNLQWRAEFLSALSSINSNLSSIDSRLQQIINIIPSDSVDYSSLSNRISSLSAVSGINDLYFDSSSALNALDLSNYDTSDPDFPAYYNSLATSYDRALKVASALSGLSALRPEIGAQSGFNQFAKDFGNSFGAGAAYHYTTPLTNEMKRMTTDWVNETKAALSNNTQKIKDDLAAWKNQLHGTQTSIDNSAANINNTLNNIAGGSSVVRVNVQNQDIGVTITDPVTIDTTQFNAFSEDLGKAGDYMERLFNEFKWWAWDSPDSWKKGFLDRDFSRLSSNVQEQVSLQHSISNLLSDFASNFTNNTEFAISNALAGFTFSSTNGYLLLSDYQSFIDSSKYNSVVSSLPDDLAAALSSFGFSDSSAYSGRWWVFQSANMALQSQLALTNAALSSTLLNALSAIDDSDDSGGSLLSRWLSLIDSIPDPEEIQQSLSDATNIVSNIGFERADALYSTATQDLVSVVKGIYRDKSLPDNIRFVFIPAAQGREEKFVDIPVGEHSSLWSLFRSGMAFALSVVTLILFPKYVSWLVAHYTRLVERIIKSLHAYTHQ